MKKFINFFVAAVLMLGAAPVMTSCSSDDDPKTPAETLDLAVLNTLITECQNLANGASTDDYPEAAITEFKTVISNVVTAKDAVKTQSAVEALVTQLTEARATFLKKAYGAIDESAVIAKWTFDTDATNQVSEGVNKWTAVCKESPSCFPNKVAPKFVEGVNGKAVMLEDGAHLEVSDFSQAAVTPLNFSISAWVKTSKTYANNYIVSYNYWNTWKLQVQDQNKPFFTFATDAGIADADNETDQSVKEGEWTMVTVTLSLTDHTLNFYINGELTKSWNQNDKPALAGTSWATYTSKIGALPIFIGLATSEAEATAAWDWEWSYNDLGAFYGAIDNLTFYNVALTAGQVKKLYKDKN